MAFIKPDTTIWLISGCELTPDYRHTFLFKSKSEQSRYFSDKGYILNNYNYTNFSDNKIRIGNANGVSIDDKFLTYNYMMFKNSNFGLDKIYYAFILSATRVGNNCIEYTYQIDVMQTYWFDFEMTPCFVEREHVLSDSPFEHRVPEPFNNFRYTYGQNSKTTCDTCPVVIALYVKNNSSVDGTVESGVYSGCSVFKYQFSPPITNEQISDLNGRLTDLVKDGGTIVAMYQITNDMLFSGITEKTDVIYLSDWYNGLPIKNNKLFSSPFTWLEVTNNVGEVKKYAPELFNTWYYNEGTGIGAIRFKRLLNGGTSPTQICIPESYKNVYYGQDNNSLIINEGVTLTEFPVCSWNNDSFIEYWVSNKNSAVTSMLINSAMLIGSVIATAGTGGTAAPFTIPTAISSASSIGLELSKFGDKYDTPDKVGGKPILSNINNLLNRVGFTYSWLQLEPETAKKIDDYFTMYGYQVNELKTPNVKNYIDPNLTSGVKNGSLRPYWNYVKTNGAIIHPKTALQVLGIPGEYEKIISNIFDNGITFWLQHGTGGRSIGDYDKDNTPKPDADPWSEG